MRVAQARSDICINILQQRHSEFMQAGAQTVNRLYTVSLKEGKIFYSLALALQSQGSTTFAEIWGVNAILYGSFEEACKTPSILADDAE